MTNLTNLTANNETNATLLMEIYDYLFLLANALYEAWDPILYTTIKYEMMIIIAMEERAKMVEAYMKEVTSLMYALKKLVTMLETIWKQLNGLFKMLTILLNSIQQILNLIGNIELPCKTHIIDIALILQLLGWLFGIINFLSNLINQILSLIQAISDFLKTIGSYLIKVIENAAIIIISFMIITIGAFFL